MAVFDRFISLSAKPSGRLAFALLLAISIVVLLIAVFTPAQQQTTLSADQKKRLSEVHIQLKNAQVDDAEKTFKKHLEELKNKPVLLTAASIDILQKRYKRACSRLFRLQQRYEQDALILNNLAICYVYQNNYAAAKTAFDTAEQIAPLNAHIKANKDHFLKVNAQHKYLEIKPKQRFVQ